MGAPINLCKFFLIIFVYTIWFIQRNLTFYYFQAGIKHLSALELSQLQHNIDLSHIRVLFLNLKKFLLDKDSEAKTFPSDICNLLKFQLIPLAEQQMITYHSKKERLKGTVSQIT